MELGRIANFAVIIQDNLNSWKGVCKGDYIGEYYRAY